MRKEVGYAIIGGVALGLVIAYGVYRIKSEVAKNKTAPTPSATSTPTASVVKEFKVVLAKPDQNFVTNQSTISVSGITKQSVNVAIIGESKDYFLKTDSSGGFNKSIELVPGINQIKVVAFDPSGKPSDATVLVVYSSSFVTKSGSTATESTATSEADINKKVVQNITDALSAPKAYIGTVTDITDATIEIKTKLGEIQQISISPENTSVVNIMGTNNKTVKTSDIAIGDFIVAMGYVGNSSVLSAQRILIADPTIDSKTSITMAKVTGVSKKSLTVSTLPDSQQKTVTPDTKTQITTLKDNEETTLKFASVAEGNTLIYTDVPDPKATTRIRSVFVTGE